MSPTPQIVPVDIFSGGKRYQKSESSDDANYSDSANLSHYNIFPEDELNNENSQNLSGIIQKFNERNMHIDYNNWNERRSIMVKDQSECLALSPFDNKTMNI